MVKPDELVYRLFQRLPNRMLSLRTIVIMAALAVVILVATFLSGLVVRRRLDHLDLVAVLKSKE